MSQRIRALIPPLCLCIALFPAVVSADNATYSPSSRNIAGAVAFSEMYALQITSPSNLNNAGDTLINGSGVTVTMKVTATSWPASSSAAAAEALVTLSTPGLTFTALSQMQSVNVTFTATASTLPGDYSYSIQADPPTGLGWGVGSHTLNVEVSEPTLVDTTPPNVAIVAPADGDSYTFCSAGVTVPIEVSASDAESVVTSVLAEVNGTNVALSYAAGNNVTATGSYAAGGVGVYTVNASATSAGGTGSASEVSFTVKYNTTWLPPLALGKTSKGGSTIPIKVTARDCEGAFVHDESVRIAVHEGSAEKFSAVFGEGDDYVRIDDLDGHYITNFRTEAGTHTYTVKVYFNDVLHASTNFSVR